MSARILPFLVIALAAMGCAGKRPVPPVEPPPAPIPARAPAIPLIRIGLRVHAAEARVGSPLPFSLADERGVMVSGEGNGAFLVRRENGDLLVYTESGELLGLASGVLQIAPNGDEASTGVDDAEVTVDGARYPGRLEVRLSPKGGLNVVNLVDVESYLRGVVPLEIGHRGDFLEAAKAQAVAARTYTAGHLRQYPEEGFDLEAGVQDQVYGSTDRRHPDADRAVRETEGLILVHEGRPIRANYSSTCGGHAAAVEESFDTEPLPYLKQHADRLDDADACRTSKYYRWEEKWSGDDLVTMLARTVPAVTRKPWEGKSLRKVEVIERGPSGRALRLRVQTDKATYEIAKGAIRRVLLTRGGSPLWSTAFELEAKTSGGKVKRLTAKGRGWGHGVGMCQWGAMQLSREDHAFRDILQHYYPGTQLKSWYRDLPSVSGREHEVEVLGPGQAG